MIQLSDYPALLDSDFDFPVNARIRRLVFAAWDNVCAYCMERPAEHLDHIIPRSKGGPDNLNNYAAACEPCNLRKSTHMMGPGVMDLTLRDAQRKAKRILAQMEAEDQRAADKARKSPKARMPGTGVKKSAHPNHQTLTSFFKQDIPQGHTAVETNFPLYLVDEFLECHQRNAQTGGEADYSLEMDTSTPNLLEWAKDPEASIVWGGQSRNGWGNYQLWSSVNAYEDGESALLHYNEHFPKALEASRKVVSTYFHFPRRERGSLFPAPSECRPWHPPANWHFNVRDIPKGTLLASTGMDLVMCRDLYELLKDQATVGDDGYLHLSFDKEDHLPAFFGYEQNHSIVNIYGADTVPSCLTNGGNPCGNATTIRFNAGIIPVLHQMLKFGSTIISLPASGIVFPIETGKLEFKADCDFRPWKRKQKFPVYGCS